MTDWLSSPWLWLLIALGLCALAWWVGYPSQPTSPRPTTPAICAWCKWRDGEDCTHPKSPAYPGPVGEVCAGRVKCEYYASKDRGKRSAA